MSVDNLVFEVNAEEFAKEGLATPGAFLFRVDSVRGTSRKYGTGDDAEEYPIIQMRLTATHTVETDEEGNVTAEVELDRSVSRPFEEFKLSGSPARKIRTLYQAITGRPLTGVDGSGNINLLSAAEELIGGSAWNNVFHASYKRDDGTVGWKDMLTNTFKSKAPKRVRIDEEQ